jgi:hypothetical protein
MHEIRGPPAEQVGIDEWSIVTPPPCARLKGRVTWRAIPACSRYKRIGKASDHVGFKTTVEPVTRRMLAPVCMERGASETLPRTHSPSVRRRCETETTSPTENRHSAAALDSLAAGAWYADPAKATPVSAKPRGGLLAAGSVSEQAPGAGAADEEGTEAACDVVSAAQVAIRLFTTAGRSSVGRLITRRA